MGLKRLQNLTDFLLEMDAMENEYVRMAKALLEWIAKHVTLLQNTTFPNNLQGLLVVLADFKTYRTVVKPPRFVDRGNLEAHLFNIQTKLFARKHPMYRPPDGLLISDINAKWQVLEQAEHARCVV